LDGVQGAHDDTRELVHSFQREAHGGFQHGALVDLVAGREHLGVDDEVKHGAVEACEDFALNGAG